MTGLSGKSMIVFDNSADTIAMLQAWFDTVGLMVHGASPTVSPAALGDLLRQERPHVVVFDLGLPYDTSISALRQLHEEGAFGAIPVIVTTTNAQIWSQLTSGVHIPVHDVIEKPYDVESLMRSVVAAAGPPARCCEAVG